MAEKISDLRHLFATVLLAGFGTNVVMPAITDVTMESVCPGQDECSLAIYLSGFQQAIIGLGAMVMTPLIGNLSDKYGRKTLLTLPVTLSILPSAILAYRRSTNFFYAYYVVKTLTSMLSDGSLCSLALAYAADKIPAGRRISAFGIVSGVFTASILFGNLAARFLSIAAIFQVSTSVSLIATVYMRIFLEESIPDENQLSQPIFKTEEGDNEEDVPELAPTLKTIRFLKEVISLLRSSSTFSRTAIVCFFNDIPFAGMLASMMYYLKARFQFSKDQFADFMVFSGVMGTISQLIVVPPLSAAIGDKKLLSIALFSSFTQMFIFSISWSSWVAYASVTFILVTWCVTPAVSSIASKQVEPHEQGKVQGCITGIQCLANVISPLLFNPLTALFLSVDAPFYFPGFSFLCLALSTFVAFILSLKIQVNSSILS